MATVQAEKLALLGGTPVRREPLPVQPRATGEGALENLRRVIESGQMNRTARVWVKRLEEEIDQLNAHLGALNSFVLPGGGRAAAALHFARTVARRAERDMVALAQTEAVNAPALRYINRLSDFLFVAARFANDQGKAEVFWQSGATR